MKENVGPMDRLLRAVVGPGLVALGYATLGGNRGKLGGLAAMLGGALIVESAITRVCPLNHLLGIDTRPPRQRLRDLEETIRHARWSPPVRDLVRH